MGRKQQYDALMDFIARVQGATGLTTPHIERAINSGIDISTATPNDVYKFVMGRDLLGPAKEYVPPAKKNISAAIPGLSFEERVASDPNIQSAIKMAGPAIARTNPELAQRVAAGDTEAMLEVYRMVVRNKGEMPAARDVDPFENIAAADMGDLPQEFAPMSDAKHDAFVKARQLELGLDGDNVMPSTALVPFGVRGGGVPVAGVAGPGVSNPTHGDMILARILGIHGPQQGRLPAPSILGLPAPRQARLAGPEILGLPGQAQARLASAGTRSLPVEVVDAVDDVGPVANAAGPARRGMNPLAAAAATGLAAAAGGTAIHQLLKQSEPLTEASGPESSPIQDEDVTLADDSDSLTEAGNPAELTQSVHSMIYPDGPADREDALTRAEDVALGGTLIRPSETIGGMTVGGMNPLKARRINDATQAVIDADRAIQRYNQNNNPWRRR